MTRENVLKAGAVSLVGSSASAASALLVAVVVGRSVGAAGAGVFFQAVAIFTIVSAVLRLGTSSALIWALSQRRALGRTGGESRIVLIAVWPVLVVSVAVALGMYAAADQIAGVLSRTGAPALSDVLRLLAWFVVPASLMGVLHTAVRVQRGVLSFSMLQDVAIPVSRLAGVSIAALAGAGAYTTIAFWIASLPFWLLLTMVWLVRPVVQDLRATRRAALDRDDEDVVPDMTGGRFWRYSAPRALGVAIEFGLDWVDVLVVAALRTPAEAGVYAVASRCIQAGRVVDRAVRVAAAPTISWHLARREHVEASRLHLDITRVAVLISWPFYLTLAVMGPAVLAIFGPSFRRGAFVVGLLGLVMMVVVSAGMLQSILLMGGRSTWQVYNKGVALALSVVGNLLLVPRIGISGAAVTWAAVVAVDTAIAAWLVHSRMGVHLMPHRLLRAGLVPVGVFGTGGLLLRLALGTSILDLLVYLGVLLPVYAVVVWRWWRVLELDISWRAATSSARARTPPRSLDAEGAV